MESTEEPQLESRYAWFMTIVASAIMGMGAGALISISTFLKPVIAEFGWLRGEASFAYMAGAIVLGFSGIGMGWLSDRYSTRPVIIVGVIAVGGSLVLLSTQTALWQFYLYYCILGGFGIAAFDAPLIANVGNWFNRNKGLALGIATAGRALGQGGIPFIAGLLISSTGWRDAYFILGITCWVVLLPLALLVRNPPGLAEAKAASRKANVADIEKAYPVRPKLAIGWVGVASMFCCTCMGTAMVHAVAIAQDAGLGAEQAAGVILIIYVSGFFGRLSFGKMSDHIGGIRAYGLASLGQTVFVFWFTQMEGIAGFYALAVFFGFFMAGVMTGLVVSIRELTPIHMRGTANGFMHLLAWFGMGFGGYQAGLFFDWYGNYIISYANAAAAGLINLVLVGSLYLYIRRKTPLQVPVGVSG
jgi:MFS family permease